MDAPCSDLHIDRISEKIDRWEVLAPYFDVFPEEVQHIRAEYPGQYSVQKREMLWKWKQRLGKKATYSKLKESCFTAGNQVLADEVDKLLHNPFSPFSHDEEREMEFVKRFIAEQGSIRLRVVRCIFYGLPATGKTCTRKRLTGRITNLTQASLPSTNIEKSCTVNLFHKTEQCSVHLTRSLMEWEEQDVAAQCQTLLKHIMLVFRDPRFSNPPIPTHLPHKSLPKDGALERFIKNIVSTKQWKEIREGLKAIEEMTILHITDTGGQPQFHDILPLLLQGPAIFLLFFNLTKQLDELCEVSYHCEEGRRSAVYESQFTVKEILFQLLASVASHSTDRQNATVMFIGTYFDRVGAQGLNHREEELKDIIQSTELFKKDVVNMFKQEGERSLIFPLDNIDGSFDEVGKLRDSIALVIERAFNPTSLPVSWLLFHLVLRSEYEADPGYCTLEQCKKVAESCGIPAGIVVDVLKFMHKKFGTILYYNNVPSLTSVVICNPNAIFMHATKLVTLSFGANPNRPNMSKEIRVLGEINPSLMEEEKQKKESPFSMGHVVELFTHYNIISQIKKSDGSRVYFMPCLLLPDPTVGREEKVVLSGIDPAPLLLLFNTGYVPVGLFSALVVYLSKLSSCVIDPYEQRYRNKITFLVNESTDLILIGHINCLELRVESPDSSTFATICPYVVSIVKDAIDHLKSHHKYLKFHNSLGFYCCSDLELKHGAPHAAVCMETDLPQASWNEVSPTYMRCQSKTKCAKHYSKLLDKHKVWFSQVNQNSDSSANSTKATGFAAQQPPIPENPTTENLQEVTVAGEKLFTFMGSTARDLVWEQYGFFAHVGTNAFFSDQVHEVAVKALVGGKFKFPPDCVLVSAVYAVVLSDKLQHPIKVKLQHCVNIQTLEQAQRLSFVRADFNQPPYTFRALNSGTFDVGSAYGSILCQNFSLVAIVYRIHEYAGWLIQYLFPPPPVNSNITFCAKLFYCFEAGEWNFSFVLYKKLRTHDQYVATKMKGTKEWAEQTFGFKKECVTLELEKRESIDGWELSLRQYPCQFWWKDVRQSDDPEIGIRCFKMDVFPGHDAKHCLHYEVQLTGTVEDNLSFLITCRKTAGSVTHSPPALDSATQAPTFIIEHLDIIKQELPNFVKWKTLGLRLGLSPTKLEQIEADYRVADERLHQVLTDWLRRNYNTDKYGSPSWDCLVNALDPIDHALADSIRESHC